MAFNQLKINDFFDGFLDRPAVEAAVERARLRVMNRVGGNIRTIAKRSIRHAPAKRRNIKARSRAGYDPRFFGSSAPGDPPFTHTGLLRKHIYYAYDFSRSTGIVGPALLNQRSSIRPVGKTVPQVLEEGGRAESSRMDRTFHMEPRPYMYPAFKKSQKQYANLWKDSIRGE